MPLPTIEVPNYKIDIISIPETITYRPFLVKEEKILLTALTGEDETEIINAIKQIISNCIIEPEININILPLLDIEILFINLRSKSVGSISTIGLPCNGCEEQNQFEISLDDIQTNVNENHTTDIELVEDTIGVRMKYPSVDILTSIENTEESNSEISQVYDLVSNCIQTVYTPEEEFQMTDYTDQERTEFFESLTQTHFLQIQEFFDTMPYIYYTLKYVCEHCKHKEEIDVRGIQNFFT